VHYEIGQIVRAAQARGPQTPEELRALVGAEFWEHERFDRALALAVADGMLTRQGDGRVAAV
jgi:hypothetical protein